ncbi:MAG: heme lyase CcmF/NrfE family subunit [Chloroflexi bacterium]|nr:heme lyase CcmF/NrfE family subunit [Chloroflexota bacterium]
MIDVGYIAVFLALVASAYAAIAYIWGAKKKVAAVTDSARNALIAACGLLTIAVAALLYGLVTHDFSVEYIASYTMRGMSIVYILSALWAGSSGSLLFWAWLLSIFATVVVLQRREVGKELIPYAAAITMFIQVFFLILLIDIANPFHKLGFTPADGRGLNPLLENAGMFFHPPTLLAGYVGFAIPFAFAMAALLTKRLGDEWILNIRRYTLVAWIFLTLGNWFGMWWAYVELGWGGAWAWDPVENASLLPWLTGTAFLHSIMMQRRRGMLKIWNMVLVIITFSLTIFGTFLTRSGIIGSVHTFGESALGPFFITFIGVAVVASVALLYYRSDELRSEVEMESLVSRESTFLLNNLLLVGAAFAIFLGTIFPIISEAVRGVKITVGPPFFNQVNGPIFLAVIVLAGICTLIGWRRASVKNLLKNFLWPIIGAVVITIVLFAIGVRSLALIPFFLCFFVIATIFYEWFRGVRARRRMRGENPLKGFYNLLRANRPRYGGYIVHLGVIFLALGMIGSMSFSSEAEATIKPGETMNIENYTLTYENMDNFETPTKEVVSSTLTITNSGEYLGTLTAEKYFHKNYQQPVTEVAIRSTLKEDLYVILVGWDENGTAFRVLVNPLVAWMWIGGIVMVAGGLLAFWPERRRQPVSKSVAGREAQE